MASADGISLEKNKHDLFKHHESVLFSRSSAYRSAPSFNPHVAIEGNFFFNKPMH